MKKNKDKKRIVVVLPAYNAEKTLVKTFKAASLVISFFALNIFFVKR